MILVRLTDGLGNQIFQYAAGEALRLRTGATVRFTTDAFDTARARRDRPLLLPELVDTTDRLVPTWTRRGQIARALERVLRPQGGQVRHIPNLCHLSAVSGCDPRFSRIGNGMLVSGFFQDARCVLPAIDMVRHAVQRRFGDRVGAARGALDALVPGAGRLVALHVRLGDYQQIGDGSEAIVPVDRIRALLGTFPSDARIVGFSDSHDRFASTDFGRPVACYPGMSALEDFAAMASCDDFVIGNSTFSWWASTLAANAHKRVWAPRDWLRPGRPGSDPNNPIYQPNHHLY